MAHIRDDLVGSVYLHTGGPAGPVVLVAGDVVPEGFEVGAHLLADTEPDEAEGDFTNEGEVVDESGGPDASQGPELEAEPGPAGTSEGDQPKPVPAKRAARQAKA